MSENEPAMPTPGFLADGGEMGALIRAFDWNATPLGLPNRWSQSLRIAVRLMLNTEHPMYIWWGSDLFCLYNDSYRRSIGSERHPGSLGQPARAVWAEIWDVIAPQIEHVMSGAGATWHENHLVPITRDGRREDVYWTYSYSPIDDDAASNHVGGVMVICTETTETVAAAQLHRAELERQQRMFEHAPGFIATLKGPDHVFEFTNQAYRRLIGNRDVLGSAVRGLFPEIEGQGFFEKLDHVYRTGERVTANRVPIKFVDPDNATRSDYFLDYVYAPIVDDQGKVTGIFVEGHDVTEVYLAQEALRVREKELRLLNETLEERVLLRTNELVEAQKALRQSQKLEAMGQLTGGVAHDFNNLLTPIIGGLDMLHRRGVGGEREQRLISGALQSAERAKTLVQRLLAFARRQPIQLGPVDVAALMANMADLIASTLGPRIKLQVDMEDRLATATADASQLEMAILNLSVNARDAMPDGGTLTIAGACEDVGRDHKSKLPPGSYIRVSVSDTGTGMDAATMARAIEPFFSTKGIGKGTGLGLSMVHGLASQLGGALIIDSALEHGTTVTLWLLMSGAPVLAKAGSRPVTLPNGRVGTALLVDDEDLVRASTAEMLLGLGYEVVEAARAVEALALLETRPAGFDLVVTDHIMPGMTGAELAKAVKAKWSEVPVLVISGYAEAEGIDANLARLTKPFREADLSASLAALRDTEVASSG